MCLILEGVEAPRKGRWKGGSGWVREHPHRSKGWIGIEGFWWGNLKMG